MELSEYGRMEQEEQNYWWHIGRREVLQKVLGKHIPQGQNLDILDVGCGTGINYNWLKNWGRVTGLDTSAEALDYCRNKHVYDELIQTDGTNLSFDSQFDLLTAFDVLEHIQDDISALRNWYTTLKPNGYVFITVPAYQWMWTGHDKALHHQRRYNPADLKRKLEQVGFKVVLLSPFFFFVFPVFVAVRFIMGRKEKTTYETASEATHTSGILVWLSKIEAWWLSHNWRLPWGSSLVVLAQK